ncbi:MAG: hypothetical protein GYA48_14790 [Chloroflexi bacterium]|nr:hypothetical protein [Chloroflexota bacterium]
MYDLNYLPLHLSNGKEIAELPGLWVAAAPRRAQRSRSKDMLVMLLTLTGSQAQPPDNLSQILERLADVYFQAPGSVTSGMHAAVDQLNALLIKRNLKTSDETLRVTGILNLVVLRRDQLYIAHAGPTHTYLLAQKGLTTFHDTQNAGRGLGLARSVKLAYFREEVQPNDLLLLSAAPPQDWQTSGLAGGLSIPLDQLRRRLLSQANGQLQSALIQFTPGKGEALLQKPRIPFISAGLGEKLAAQEAPSPAQPVEAPQPAPIPPAPPPRPQARPAAPEPTPARAPGAAAPQPAHRTPQMDVAQKNASRQRRNATRKELRGLLNGWRSAWQRFSTAVNRTLLRTLPGSEENTSALPVRSLVLIAVLVPLMVTALATTIYFRSGRANQRDAYLQQAQRFVSDAVAQSDPALKMSDWQQVLYWVEKSEEFGRTETSIELRRQAETALDELQGIIRLDMQPTILGGLPEGVNITRIVPTTTELYMFDSNEGRVYRMFMTGEGYQLDPNFDCASNPLIGKLVDFAPLTRLEGVISSPTVIAVNETGRYMYCGLTDKPVEQAFIPPSTGNWGQISQVTSSDYGMLYVLDVSNNAVYIIDPFYQNPEEEDQPEDATDFEEEEEVAPSHSNNEPRMFFNLQVPRLDDVKDIAFNNGDLYLLHADNTTTICTLRTSYDDQTRCTDPAPYADTRSGRETSNLTFPGASFSRMFTTQPPVPSLYILDSVGPTINQFSLQLNLQRQLSPRSATEEPLPSTPPTALAVTHNRLVIVAFGNQLYHGQLP